MIGDTYFYDKESSVYSRKRYLGKLKTYTQYFFRRRREILIGFLSRIAGDRRDLTLLDVGCADGVVTRKIAQSFPGIFSRIVGIDVSSKMVEEAKKQTDDPTISFFVRGDKGSVGSYDVVLEVGFLSPTLFEMEFPFVNQALVPGGYYICSLASRYSLHSIMKMRGKEYVKTYGSYAEYRRRLETHFEFVGLEPCGLFIPKLWTFPKLARVIQPVAENFAKLLFPNLFQETVFLLRKKSNMT